jgi:hypothetical protein
MSGFAIGIEGADGVTVQRLECTDPRELNRAAVFGCIGQHLGGRQDRWRAALSCWNRLDDVRYRLAQRRQLDAIGQHDWLGKTQGPGHDATPQRNGFKPRRTDSFRHNKAPDDAEA